MGHIHRMHVTTQNKEHEGIVNMLNYKTASCVKENSFFVFKS